MIVLSNTFWYEQFNLRQILILRGCQPFVDFQAADNCRLKVTPGKAMNFQNDISTIPNDNLKDHHVLVFDLTAIQDDTENNYHPELVGEPLRPELDFTFPPKQVTGILVLED